MTLDRITAWSCAAALLSACAAPVVKEEVPEIRPGILAGYLPMEEPLDSLAFVPPAPAPGSPRQALDEAISQRAVALRGSPRWELAQRDADLHFPEAAETFSCALGLPITEQHTPELYMLLRRTLADLGLATYPAKNHYGRARPFMANGAPTCTPGDEEDLRDDPSYPSGHTAIGWGWALILSDLAPDRAGAILSRGRAYGESRVVCNVHWYSDVEAGRLVGAAAYARLQRNEAFMGAREAAAAEVAAARERGLGSPGDCASEENALATPI
jgi:acid phosphatase (class A)